MDQSIPGKTLPFEAVRDEIAERLKTTAEERALRQVATICLHSRRTSGNR